MFDLSDYSKDSKFFYPFNKKVIGKIKDEVKWKIVSQFVGIKPKMNSLIDADCKENKKAKRFNKSVVNNIKKVKKIVDVLFNEKLIRHNCIEF